MIKIKLVIADKDEVYVKRLINFFNTNYSDKLEIYYFTYLEEVNDFIEKNKVDVLIATETFGINIKEIPKKIAFAYFSESPSIDTINNMRTVCKYQKVDLIYKEILSLYSEKTTNVEYKVSEGDNTLMLTFLSTSGGTGSSTVAAACAMNMARRGKKVLYLNLEQFGTPNVFFNAEGNFDFGEVIYSIKSKKPNLALKLESSVKQDGTGVFFYDACKMIPDIMAITAEDLKKFFHELKIVSVYDYVIIDTDFYYSKIAFPIARFSHSLIFVSDGSQISNMKFERAYKGMQLLEEQININLIQKLCIIYNKFSSKTSKYSEEGSINILGGIPKYEGATSIEIAKQISFMQFFDKFQ